METLKPSLGTIRACLGAIGGFGVAARLADQAKR